MDRQGDETKICVGRGFGGGTDFEGKKKKVSKRKKSQLKIDFGRWV